MSLFRTERPSRDKEKAIKLMEQEEMDRVCINMPYALKKRLKIHAVNNKMQMTDVLVPLIEKYLKIEEQKENK
jgi:hypothetical protein